MNLPHETKTINPFVPNAPFFYPVFLNLNGRKQKNIKSTNFKVMRYKKEKFIVNIAADKTENSRTYT